MRFMTEERSDAMPKKQMILQAMTVLGVVFWCFLGTATNPGVEIASGGQGDPINSVPTEVEMPGTQPLEITNLEDSSRCFNCHGNYDHGVEPGHNWAGSMMGQATRDPIFWATVAVAEQDFPGAGDICLRCHTELGWTMGRSEPTNGSALLDADADGVTCDVCHKATNPNDEEFLGEQFTPYLANDEGNPPIGYYGNGMLSFWGGNAKMGPYADAVARHSFEQASFLRAPEFCGTCHDVSNPVTGDLAHNAGAQATADPVVRSGIPGAPVETKAAFNNFPYMYGVVERTFSEHMASGLPGLLVSDYNTLPTELQAGSIQYAYDQAQLAGRGGDYEDGMERFFTCQTCHMAATVGKGANKKDAPLRRDLAQHDLTGGNYWAGETIKYLDAQNKLVVGGGLSAEQIEEIDDAAIRAGAMLDTAAALAVEDDELRVVNLTGHKLISGYPEGRRMWVNVKWFDGSGRMLREDGAYGLMEVLIDGVPRQVESILDLQGGQTKIYEAHFALTQEWAQQLLGLGYAGDLVLSYDRVTGKSDCTLGELGEQDPGTYHESFHFVLNNYVAADNRIPPYGMEYEEARKRNILPVPTDQYGNPGVEETYEYWDEIDLNPPDSAVRGEITLFYQPTSWEYIQFLYLANNEEDPFLGLTGRDMLDAWLETGMAKPRAVATAEWEGSGGGGKIIYRRDGGTEVDPLSAQWIKP